jgi:adenosylcobyric acid synthase
VVTAKAIFIGGTASHAGKSWVATALCRYLYRMGHKVAPFKSQNMSNNAMACPGGGEIGRAQAAQAEACGLKPHPDMNPILLKPTGNLGSQVILHGQPEKNLKASEYYEQSEYLMKQVLESYRRLAAEFEYVVVEGAGSVSELNLKHHDLVNLRLAAQIAARALLVADVDRGGVFASVIGTFHLLDAQESSIMPAFLINRFRGDPELFRDGVKILEKETRRPCLGVFPFAPDIYLDPEDSICLETRVSTMGNAKPPIAAAIVRLPHISNFTDFRLLPYAEYVAAPVDRCFDAVFIPGTKNTIDDMLHLHSSGLAGWIREQAKAGARIIGVCGGFQMLGEEVADPEGVESNVRAAKGLGLLPVSTVLSRNKTTRMVQAATPSGIAFSAYEIHMGHTVLPLNAIPFAILDDGTKDGIRAGNITGTYLHGAFECHQVLEDLFQCCLKDEPNAGKEMNYDRLADWFVEHVDQEVFFREYLHQ